MGTDYVQARNGNLYVGRSRVTLDSVVIPWRAGVLPEAIQADYPTVPLSHIYGAIAYSLEHQEDVDRWITEGDDARRAGRVRQEEVAGKTLARLRSLLAQRKESAVEASNESLQAPDVPASPTTASPAD